MGWVTKTPTGRYRAGYRSPDGRQVTATFTRKADAQAWLAGSAHSVNSGIWLDPRLADTPFSKVRSAWTSGRSVERTTAAKEASWLSVHIAPAWDAWPVGAIRHSDCQRFATSLPVGPETAHGIYRLFVAVLDLAVKDRMIAANPARGVRLPPVRRAKTLAPDLATVRELVWAHPSAYRVLPALAAFAGLRWEEAAGIGCADYDPGASLLYVGRQVAEEVGGKVRLRLYPKTDASVREVPVPGELAIILHAYGGAPVLGQGPRGGLVSRNNYRNRVWLPTTSALGISLRYRDLRSFYASWLLEQGTSAALVSALLGHTNPTTLTRRYALPIIGAQDKIIGAFE